jgi:hypothetical protein
MRKHYQQHTTKEDHLVSLTTHSLAGSPEEDPTSEEVEEEDSHSDHLSLKGLSSSHPNFNPDAPQSCATIVVSLVT